MRGKSEPYSIPSTLSYTACVDFLPPFEYSLPKPLQNSWRKSVFETIKEAVEVAFRLGDYFEQATHYPAQLLIQDELDNLVMNHSQIMAAYHRSISVFSYSQLTTQRGNIGNLLKASRNPQLNR
jgi:hypothetical protein